MSHTIRGQMCGLFAMCFHVSVQQKHQEFRTIFDVAIFGCDGVCFDTLSDMFRSLFTPRPIFEVPCLPWRCRSAESRFLTLVESRPQPCMAECEDTRCHFFGEPDGDAYAF